MRPTSVTLGAAGVSSWTPVNVKQSPFNVSLGVTLTSGATLTYKVQHTFDDMENLQRCSITRSGTTATLTLVDHGVQSTSDSITVRGADAPFDGVYAVASIVDANTITYAVANSGATSSSAGAGVIITRVFDHSVLTGKTASSDSNYIAPITAVRLNNTAYTSGKSTLTIVQGK